MRLEPGSEQVEAGRIGDVERQRAASTALITVSDSVDATAAAFGAEEMSKCPGRSKLLAHFSMNLMTRDYGCPSVRGRLSRVLAFEPCVPTSYAARDCRQWQSR